MRKALAIVGALAALLATPSSLVAKSCRMAAAAQPADSCCPDGCAEMKCCPDSHRDGPQPVVPGSQQRGGIEFSLAVIAQNRAPIRIFPPTSQNFVVRDETARAHTLDPLALLCSRLI
jgi:hypothetical protein